MDRADRERLDGLARNPAAPESVLLRILTGAEGRGCWWRGIRRPRWS
ncbi:hypothetical protein [Streptomyces anulatus]